MDSTGLSQFITDIINTETAGANTVTGYRKPLVGFADAEDPRFAELRRVVEPTHMLPADLLPGARSVISFFLPFAPEIVEANARHEKKVAAEWATAYVETNDLLAHITNRLIELLADQGIRAAGEPPTDNFDPVTLISKWAHKSVAVIAGIGSFGVHHLVITDAGCGGRFGSLVIDAELPIERTEPRNRCLYKHNGSCLECVSRCPVNALDENRGLDKQLCWKRCLGVAKIFEHIGTAQVCCKCGVGVCALKAPV
jgi:epoxyqueuosine reductase